MKSVFGFKTLSEELRERSKWQAYLTVDGYIGYSRPGTSEHVMRIVSGEFSAVVQTAAAVPLSDNVACQTRRPVPRVQQRHSVQMLNRRVAFRSGQVVSETKTNISLRRNVFDDQLPSNLASSILIDLFNAPTRLKIFSLLRNCIHNRACYMI